MIKFVKIKMWMIERLSVGIDNFFFFAWRLSLDLLCSCQRLSKMRLFITLGLLNDHLMILNLSHVDFGCQILTIFNNL